MNSLFIFTNMLFFLQMPHFIRTFAIKMTKELRLGKKEKQVSLLCSRMTTITPAT